MSYRNVARAEEALFGSRSFSMSNVAFPPGGADSPNDLAQAWLDGDRARVLVAVKAHEDEVRARPVIVKRVTLRTQIVKLRRSGWRTRDIAVKLNCHAGYVTRCCRGLPRPARTAGHRRTVNPDRLATLGATGLTLKQIAAIEGLHYSTVSRVLRGLQ